MFCKNHFVRPLLLFRGKSLLCQIAQPYPVFISCHLSHSPLEKNDINVYSNNQILGYSDIEIIYHHIITYISRHQILLKGILIPLCLTLPWLLSSKYQHPAHLFWLFKFPIWNLNLLSYKSSIVTKSTHHTLSFSLPFQIIFWNFNPPPCTNTRTQPDLHLFLRKSLLLSRSCCCQSAIRRVAAVTWELLLLPTAVAVRKKKGWMEGWYQDG